MRDYLTFMSECERLKDLFLLEAEEEKDKPEEDSGESTEKQEEPSPEKEEGKEKSADGEENADSGDADIDLDTDSDLAEVTGDESLEEKPEQVNAEPAAPGSVDPKTLLSEMSTGDDNIYDRVIGAASEKFPNKQCTLKDMLPIVAIAIKSFMRNKNYAPLPKDTMKAMCLNVVKTIRDRCSVNAAKRQQPVQESADDTGVTPALMEGWKDWFLAGAMAAAPAMGATAPSAPEATLMGTPRYSQSEFVKPHTDYMHGKQDVQKSKAGKKVVDAPVTNDYSKVQFDATVTYRVTPEQMQKMKAAGNVPAHTVVDDGKAQAKAGDKNGSQAAVKQQAKSGKTSAEVSGRCKASDEKKASSEDVKKVLHKTAHDAVDLGIKGVGAAWGGLKGAVKGAVKGWKDTSRGLDRQHDQMAADHVKKK